METFKKYLYYCANEVGGKYFLIIMMMMMMMIDVLTVQCHSVVLEIIGWSFSSPARSTDD